MNEIATTIILFLIIIAQVYYIFFHDPEIYEEYYSVLIIIPATVAAYLLVIYFQRKISHMSKPNALLSKEEYNEHVDQESKRKVDQLLRSQLYQKYQAIREGRQPEIEIPEDKKKEQQQIIDELEAMERQIFDDE